jgi:hypothetical protein
MILHIHTSLKTISWPNAVVYAYPISPIADNIIEIDNNNNQIGETIGEEEDTPSSPLLHFVVFFAFQS